MFGIKTLKRKVKELEAISELLKGHLPVIDMKVQALYQDSMVPEYAKPGDAGLDLFVRSYSYNPGEELMTYGTGIAVEIPEGYVGLVIPRSSSYKTGLEMANSIGVIDSGYRGEIKCMYRISSNPIFTEKGVNPFKGGDRVAQLVIVKIPFVNIIEAAKLSETERGTNGFGSTGR